MQTVLRKHLSLSAVSFLTDYHVAVRAPLSASAITACYGSVDFIPDLTELTGVSARVSARGYPQGNKVVALPDTCPHRGAPLSLGKAR